MADIEIIKGADNGNPPDTLRQMYPKVNRNFKKINDEIAVNRNQIDVNKNEAKQNLENHESAPEAHKANQIIYGNSTVKDELDKTTTSIQNTNSRIDNLIITGGDSSPEVADARGSYPVLGARLDNLDDKFNSSIISPVTLQPGLQVIEAERDARFKLGQIEGKTDINGQGRIGLIGVENPYVINTSGNLLPPFYEWQNGRPDGAHVSDAISKPDPYTITLTSTAQALVSCAVKLVPNNTYVFDAVSFEEVAHWFVYKLGDYATVIADGISPFTFTPGESDYVIGLYKAIPGAVTFKNPSLTIGTEPKPFTPQRKSMLAFQTELHANPTDGTEPDILFEQDGQYKKLAKWRKQVLNGNWTYNIGRDTDPGFKVVVALGISVGAVDYSGIVTKYNGTLLQTAVSAWDPDRINGNISIGDVWISISNADSGWGDDYTPTQDEIKAYFNGWRMFLLGEWTTVPYNGSGTPAWVRITDTPGPNPEHGYQTTAPSYSYEGWSHYNLLYRLARETVEPVVTEGSLLLSEGSNMVEVGTGIVLRERANPVAHSNGTDMNINNSYFPASLLKNKTGKILMAFKDSVLDYTWTIFKNDSYGNEGLYASVADYNNTAAYSVTYLKLDKSPIQPITGALAANEKAQISDLTAGVTEALQRVSVVEQKKAEKDAPGWITPTLLNGATQGADPVRYKKSSDGVVRIAGIFVPVAGGAVFKLPVDYRPKHTLRLPLFSADVSGAYVPAWGAVEIDGSVIIISFGNQYASFDGISFLID